VTLIDGWTNGVVDTVAVGSDPMLSTYDPTSNEVFCGQQEKLQGHRD